MVNNSKVSIFISGDFCPIHRVASLLELKNVDVVFKDILPIIRNADISITNLECPLSDSNDAIKKTGPVIKGNPASLSFLEFAGFNILTLANNHILDYGQRGLEDTIKAIGRTDLKGIGAGMNYEDASNICFTKVNGLEIAFLNFAENEWSTTFGNNAGANPIDPILNFYQIKKAREIADKVIVICHGGHEMYRLPSPRMKKLFRFYVDSGADAVINHHTHVVSGYEVYHKAPIFYSLGNFLFDNPLKRNNLWNKGIAVVLNVTKDNIDFTIYPFSQCNERAEIILQDGKAFQDEQDKMLSLNDIIADDDLLLNHFYEFVRSNKKLYNTYLEPHGNRILNALRNRNLFPSLWNQRKKLYLLNLVRCESHRDIILNLLKEE